jgi:hypothetical protein
MAVSKADAEMTSVSGLVATIHAQNKLCGDMVRPRWLVGRLLAGGEESSRAATHEARAANGGNTCSARGWSQPSLDQMNEEVAGPL